MAGASNRSLHQAKSARNDEFYTQLGDIENELKHYRKHFKGKTVLCNCDDPFESNFFKYFVLNFNRLKLKKLIATCYAGSSIAGKQMSLFAVGEGVEPNTPYKAVVTVVRDADGDGGIDMLDVAELFRNGENELTKLAGDGDFRSPECLALLAAADIVVTNPPFSLFREYVAQLMKHDKKFLIIGSKNAITYKEFFPLLKEDKVWIGYTNPKVFMRPDGETKTFGNIGWYTNLDIKKRHEELVLVREYDPERYPKYDNYDAIEVGKVAEIPCDYEGVMGVPITFLDKYNPEQFEIVGMDLNSMVAELGIGKIGQEWINSYRKQGGTGHITANMHSLVGYDKDGKPFSNYRRILIRNRHPESLED